MEPQDAATQFLSDKQVKQVSPLCRFGTAHSKRISSGILYHSKALGAWFQISQTTLNFDFCTKIYAQTKYPWSADLAAIFQISSFLQNPSFM